MVWNEWNNNCIVDGILKKKNPFSLKFSSATVDSHVGLIMNLLLKLVNKNQFAVQNLEKVELVIFVV